MSLFVILLFFVRAIERVVDDVHRLVKRLPTFLYVNVVPEDTILIDHTDDSIFNK